MASDSSSASRSASENNELVRKSGNAAIFSSDSPAWLPPAALMSSQNAQPTSIAARLHRRTVAPQPGRLHDLAV
jgi:hypothetical protein